ncbi:VOC family protein [Nocardia sp. NPDC050408]|uniref:VOC family protein n=1 Tax=Nocardia sp. NPDC050408 TaxID=3364319 RepID=UPI0037B1D595
MSAAEIGGIAEPAKTVGARWSTGAVEVPIRPAKKFYSDVFGFSYTEFDFGDAGYVVFTPPTRTEGVGGIADESGKHADGMPSYWLVWFQHDDVDAGVAKTTELGGRVLQAIADSPAGRSAVIAGPQGEAIGIIDPSKAVGEMPAPKA